MADDVRADQFTIFRVEGMHCHRCNETIQKALKLHAGVHEVEVDFASGQASVLFDRDSVTVKQLMESVNGAGIDAFGMGGNRAFSNDDCRCMTAAFWASSADLARENGTVGRGRYVISGGKGSEKAITVKENIPALTNSILM